jgi:hypothetical protein
MAMLCKRIFPGRAVPTHVVFSHPVEEAHIFNRIARGDLILMVAFGAGLTWGAAVLEWQWSLADGSLAMFGQGGKRVPFSTWRATLAFHCAARRAMLAHFRPQNGWASL